MKRWLLAFAIIIFFLQACQKTDESRLPASSKIVFLSNREAPKGQFDIFLMNPDGSDQINLTPELQTVRTLSRPVLSPDGKEVLFVAFENGRIMLQRLNIDGRTVKDVAEVGFDPPNASFSPQGDKILFTRKIDGRRQIFIVDRDGGNERYLSEYDYDEFDPSFSADGKRIVFVSKHDGSFFLCTMNPNGSKRKVLTQQSGKIQHPSFSPRGDLIVFNVYQKDASDIYVIKRNGKGVVNLTSSRYIDEQPLFSPDGSKIIFLSNRRGRRYSDICVINTKGELFKNLTDGLNFINKAPIIARNGKFIVFESIKFNDCEIYRVDLDGKELLNLSNHPGWDQSPGL